VGIFEFIGVFGVDDDNCELINEVDNKQKETYFQVELIIL